MKRRFIMLLAASLAVFMLAGCGDKKKEENGTQEIEDNIQDADENTDASADDSDADDDSANVTLKDFNAEAFVTLGEYKGLEVTVPKAAVDEAEQQMYVENIFQINITEEVGVTDRAVEDGDLVFISYVGTLDGEAFSGGTSNGTFLGIGSGSYIDGFEEGLIGVMPGETVDLNLKFPDPYDPNPDMSGADTVFSVTVIYIAPEMSDEVILAMNNANFSNVEELNQYVYDQLMVEAEYDYDLSVENAVIEALLDNCVFGTLPQNLVNKYTQNIMYNLSMAASSYGYDVDSYTNILYGMDSIMIAAQFGEDSAKQGLAFQVIANLEDLNVTDEELDAQLQQYVEDYGLSSIEELLGDTDKEDYRDFFMFDKVIEYLIENAVINEE